MIYAATGEEGIGNGYLPRDASGHLNLAIPNGTPGSGLTVLVGPNGGGKSSIVECFNKISLARKNVSFSKGKRNLRAGDLVEIAITSDEGQGTLRTSKGGSLLRFRQELFL